MPKTRKRSLNKILAQKLGDPNIIFLLSAGVSFCAGLPGVLRLTDLVHSLLHNTPRKTFEEIIQFLVENRIENPNIEEILSELYHRLSSLAQPSKKRDSLRKSTSSSDSLWIRQKEPELLKKILILMNSNAKIFLRRRKKYKGKIQDETYYIYIFNIKIYEDLVNLGLTPDKSRKVKFPEVPPKYVRHFIRGCWDGDGSVFFEKKRPNYLIAHFVSGSRDFIKSMVEHLKKAGLPERTIYETKGRRPSYYIKYSGYPCKKLYHFLYDNVPSTQYLERKYSLFRDFAETWLL